MGALVRKEHSKPPGQRDEELVHTLRVRFFKLQLANAKASFVCDASLRRRRRRRRCRRSLPPPEAAMGLCASLSGIAGHASPRLNACSWCVPPLQARAAKYANYAVGYAWPAPWQQCCAAAAWVRQRAAASYRALHDFYSQIIQQVRHGSVKRWQGVPACSVPQVASPTFPAPAARPYLTGSTLPAPYPLQGTEELAAAQARRPAVIAAEPTLHLDLSGALQQQPPRLDMCRACARWLEQVGRRGAGRMVETVSWPV